MTLPTRRALSTAELEALMLLQEVRRHGGYVLLDLQGCIHVRHVARIPVEFEKRMALHYPEIVRLILETVQ